MHMLGDLRENVAGARRGQQQAYGRARAARRLHSAEEALRIEQLPWRYFTAGSTHAQYTCACACQGPIGVGLLVNTGSSTSESELGTLEPLQGCTALIGLGLSNNRLTGGLEPLKGCTALEKLYLTQNDLSTGGVDLLQSCTALQVDSLIKLRVSVL